MMWMFVEQSFKGRQSQESGRRAILEERREKNDNGTAMQIESAGSKEKKNKRRSFSK